MADVTVTVKPNGPLLVQGPIDMIDPTGNPVRLPPDRPVALCRCGQSAQKPFCDGSHARTGFSHCDRVADRI
jgi:CDGSH-type Zn-finger protein